MLPENKPRLVSPLQDLSNDKFKGGTYSIETTVAVNTSPIRLLANNPNRLHWFMENEGIYDAKFSTIPITDYSTGFVLAAKGGFASMAFDEDGEVVGLAIYGIAIATATTLRIVEVIRQ